MWDILKVCDSMQVILKESGGMPDVCRYFIWMDGPDVEAYSSALVGLCYCAHMVCRRVPHEQDYNFYSHVNVGV
jgi:hypothetical protein